MEKAPIKKLSDFKPLTESKTSVSPEKPFDAEADGGNDNSEVAPDAAQPYTDNSTDGGLAEDSGKDEAQDDKTVKKPAAKRSRAAKTKPEDDNGGNE